MCAPQNSTIEAIGSAIYLYHVAVNTTGSCAEKKKCFVCGIWPVAESEAFEKMMDFESPDTPVKPFIEAGDIILPMYSSVIDFKAIDRHIR